MLNQEEIERKWVAVKGKNFPNFTKATISKNIMQFYTKIDSKSEVRYRKSDEKYYITEKEGEGVKREERERDISKSDFSDKIKNRIGNIIEKKRYLIRHGKFLIEIDDYFSPVISGRVIIEVEFPSLEDAKKFKIEDVFKNKNDILVNFLEVTDDNGYKNKNIALKGFP